MATLSSPPPSPLRQARDPLMTPILSAAAVKRIKRRTAETSSLTLNSAPATPMQSCYEDKRAINSVGSRDELLASTVPGDGSPTRVADFDGTTISLAKRVDASWETPGENDWRAQNPGYQGLVHTSKNAALDEDEEDSFALQSGLAPPDISRTPFQHRRRDRERRQVLPTLVETSSTSSAEESPRNRKSLSEAFAIHQAKKAFVFNSSKGDGDEDCDEDDDSFFLHDEKDNIQDEKENRRAPDENVASTPTNRPPEGGLPVPSSSALTTSQVPNRNQQEVLQLKEQAVQLALRGREEEAIDSYRRALRMTRMDLRRIKEQLRFLKHGQHHEQRRRQEALHDDWWNVALIVAEIRTMMGILYERLGDYDRAIICCREAQEVCERQAHLDRVRQNNQQEKKSDESSDLAPQEKVAQLTHMITQLEEAKASFLRRRALHESAIQLRKKIANVNPHDKKSQPTMVDGLHKQLFDTLCDVLELERDSLGDSHPQVADTLAILSDVHAERNDLDTAIDTLHKSLSIVQLSLGECHPGTAEKLRRLAGFYQKRQKDAKDIDYAIEFYKEAVVAYKEACGGHSRLVGSTLNDLAVLHIHRQEFDEAVALLSDALVEFDSLTSGASGIHSDTAQIWRNLGECYARRLEWESAAMAYKNALEVQRNARRCYETLVHEHRQKMQQSHNPEEFDLVARPLLSDDDSIADTLKRLAKVYSALGKYNKACVVLNDALYLYQVGYHHAKGAPGDGKELKKASLLCKNQDQIAHTMYCIAEVQEKRGLHDNAINVYSEALQLRLFSDAQRCLTDQGERENMVHCAMCLAGIGSVHMNRKEYSDARRVYNDAMKFCNAHGVPSNHKIVGMLTQRLAEAELLAKAAEYTVQRGDGASLLTNSSSRSLDESTRSTDSSTGTTGTSKSDKTIMWEQIAQDCMLRGEYDQYVRLLITILATRKKRLHRKKKKLGRDHCQKEREDLARTLVNFGTVLSRKGEKQEAAVAFQEAIRLYEANGMEKSHPILVEVDKEMKKLHRT